MGKNQKLYKGEMLIQTAITEHGKQEKVVYIKDTFIKEKTIYLDTKEAQLCFKYRLEDIDRFLQKGEISSEEAESLKEEITTLDSQMKSFQKWKKTNPLATQEEEIKVFEEITKIKDLKEKELKDKNFQLAIRKLIAQKGLEKTTPLFKSINTTTHYGITKSIMDRLFHLPKLLENAVAYNTSGWQWEIKANLSDKDRGHMGPIGLYHSFTASNAEEAKKYLDDFKIWIREEALQDLNAYWKIACEKNKFNYSCSLSDVMTKNSDDSRTAFFSVKEKQRFWASTRKLENTKLTIKLDFSKNKQKKRSTINKKNDQKILIEHRLVDVGARMQTVNEDTYPNNIMVRVLNAEEFQHQSQIATAIHNNTLKLPRKDILLALTIQTRQSQTQGKETNEFDEAFLINRANLQQTANSNKSKARSDLRKKLEKIKENKIIETYSRAEEKKYIIKSKLKKNT